MNISKIINTATFKQSGIVGMTTILNGLLGLWFFTTVARYLGPERLGIFSISIAILTAVSDIADMGVNAGIIRFVGKYANDKKIADKYLKLGIKIKLIISILIITVGFVISPILANSIFQKSDLTFPLRIAFVGVAGSLVYTFITSALQALQKFIKWSSVQIGTNLIRLLLIFCLFYLGSISVNSVLYAYILMPFLGFFVGIFLLNRKFWYAKNEGEVNQEFVNYNKWIAAFVVVSAISSRLDTFISGRILTLTQVGIYAAAVQVTQVIPQIAGSIGTVIAPKMASMRNKFELITYLKKSQLLVCGIGLSGLLFLPIATIILPSSYFYGQAFVSSIPVFVILTFAMVVFLVSIPIHNSIIYYYAYPKLFWWLAVLHLFIMSILGWILINEFGIYGAAAAVMIGNIFNLIIPSIWLFNKLSES